MNLLSIAELAWRQLYPRPSDETRITREEFIETAKAEYAYQMWRRSKEEKAQEGFFNIPSNLITESEPLDVVNNEIDIKKLKILRSLPDDTGIVNVGGLSCSCEYIRSTFNLTKIFCDDDSQQGFRTYIVMKDKIKFPQGTHEEKLPIVYANDGSELDGGIEVDESIGAIVRTRLIDIYGGKVGQEDKTNNTNSNI